MKKEGGWGRELGRSQLIVSFPLTSGGFFLGSDSEHTDEVSPEVGEALQLHWSVGITELRA